jgi:hypothetical protein
VFVKPPRAELDATRLLDAVVVPNGAIVQEERRGALVLWLPLRRRWWMRAPFCWLLPLRNRRGFELDELGREVFLECDGERRLEDVIERFAERHGLRFHEARQSVSQFLASMFERKLLTLAVPEDAVTASVASSSRKGGDA